jgi:hypothetical protein
MKDWKALANASGLALTGKDLDRITQPLETLEETFRPLAKNLSPDLEPAVEFRVEAGIE